MEQIVPFGTLHPDPCPVCGSSLELVNSQIYGPFYKCMNWPSCTITATAHSDGRPMGSPATEDVKFARIVAHAAMQTMLERIRMSRDWAYQTWLPEILGRQEKIHISDMDMEDTRKVIRASQRI